MARGFLLSVHSLDVIIDKRAVVLEAKFSVITNGRFDDVFALNFFFGVAEIGKVGVFQNLCDFGSFLGVKLKHFDQKFNCIMRSSSFEPFIKRFLLGMADLLDHGQSIVSI